MIVYKLYNKKINKFSSGNGGYSSFTTIGKVWSCLNNFKKHIPSFLYQYKWFKFPKNMYEVVEYELVEKNRWALEDWYKNEFKEDIKHIVE